MKRIAPFLTKHAKYILIVGASLLLVSGIYGYGLFGSLKNEDSFYATNTSSEQTNAKLQELFGKSSADDVVVLFEKKPGVTVDITSGPAATQVSTILMQIETDKITDYYLTKQDAFLSRDQNATFAVISVKGADAKAKYEKVQTFASSVKNDMFTVSVGGALVGREQTQTQVKDDLERAELISLPVLALLLLWFFRSPIAAALPLSMSVLTIAGGLAVARIVNSFVAIDTYSLNVITILGVGLSIDYCLLAVNRFREELFAGKTVEDAVHVTAVTAGRTILFSGLTVAACLLTLQLFPVGFMHSVSVGGISAIAVAVGIATLLLPAALRVVGKNIDKFHIGRKKVASESNGWGRIATLVVKRPVVSLIVGVIIIGLSAWPVLSFKTGVFDWRVLPSNLSAHYVGQVLDQWFDTNTPSITVLANFGHAPSASDVCTVAHELQNVTGVSSVATAYTQLTGIPSCAAADMALGQLQSSSPASYGLVAAYASKYISGNYAKFDVVSASDASDAATFTLVSTLRGAKFSAESVEVAGVSALSKDTVDAYVAWMPIVGLIIIVAMVIVLSILLGSFVIPLQAVVINSLSLFIAVGVLVGIFQLGWGQSALQTIVIEGFEPSIPILMVVIAFGLSMDYAVFLYSRIHELYDKKPNVALSIIGGVAKTGPIISSAAVLMFVVVAAFGLSHVVLIQQIGFGLGVAVLVDAFFVRIFFVPAAMRLFGAVSWYAPKWLKKIVVKHD